MNRRTVSLLAGLGTMAIFAWINPAHAYDQPYLLAGILPVVLFLGVPRSPWSTWLGALPLRRDRWLMEELVQTVGLYSAFLLGFWAVVILLRVGPAGWGETMVRWSTTVVASLALTPWAVPLALRSPTQSPLNLGWFAGVILLGVWITLVSTLGGSTPGWMGIGLALVGDVVCVSGAAVLAWSRLRSRRTA